MGGSSTNLLRTRLQACTLTSAYSIMCRAPCKNSKRKSFDEGSLKLTCYRLLRGVSQWHSHVSVSRKGRSGREEWIA